MQTVGGKLARDQTSIGLHLCGFTTLLGGYRLATRQETVSGLRPPPIFVEEEIGMKPQPQRAAAYPYVVVIVRRVLLVVR